MGDRRANIHIRNSLRYRFKFSVEFATHYSPNACQRQPQSAATQFRFTSAEMRMPRGERMAQHRPALVPAIFAFLSLALSCAVSSPGAHAAPCNAKPNSQAPEGQHWYYRTDRASGRKCWFLGAEDVNNQKDAAQASKRPASDAAAQPAAQQTAYRQTMAQAPGETQPDSPTGKEWPPRSEATQLPYMPPVFLVAPVPVLEPTQAEQAQTTNGEADPPAVPASDAASEPEVPAIAQSSAAPVQPTEDANHTLALATLVFLTTVIFGAALEFMRWLRRRRNHVRVTPDWAEFDALYNSTGSVRHIPPPLSSFAESEKLAEELQKILDDLRTRPSFSMHEAGGLVRSG